MSNINISTLGIKAPPEGEGLWFTNEQIPEETYHALSCNHPVNPDAEYPLISASGLKMAAPPEHCPAHWLDHPAIDSDAVRLGSLVHTSILEPKRFEKYTVSKAKDRRDKAWKAEIEMIGEENLITKKDADTITNIRYAAIIQNGRSSELLSKKNGMNEITILWTQDGAVHKARIDRLLPGMVIDIKTSRSISPDKFGRDAGQLRYHWSMAFYVHAISTVPRLVNSGYYNPAMEAVLIAVSKTEPFGCIAYDMTQQDMFIARQQYDPVRAALINCIKTGIFPGLPERATLRIPEYHLRTEATPAGQVNFGSGSADEGNIEYYEEEAA